MEQAGTAISILAFITALLGFFTALLAFSSKVISLQESKCQSVSPPKKTHYPEELDDYDELDDYEFYPKRRRNSFDDNSRESLRSIARDTEKIDRRYDSNYRGRRYGRTDIDVHKYSLPYYDDYDD